MINQVGMSERVQYDEYLIQAAQGDLQAFGYVYDGFVKKLYDYAFFRTKDKQIAEDIVSDTFIKALEHITSFDSKKGTAASWLYRIARNTLVDHYRARQKTASLPEEYDVVDTSDLKVSIENKDMLHKVEGALQKLSEKEREIIILRVWDELSYKEIAEVLGKSESSLKMAASRALKSLRKELPAGVYVALLLACTNL